MRKITTNSKQNLLLTMIHTMTVICNNNNNLKIRCQFIIYSEMNQGWQLI